MKTGLLAPSLSIALQACTEGPGSDSPLSDYLDNTGRGDVLSGGVTMIPIETPSGTVRVWTKRVGNIISNMMASIPAYKENALMASIDPVVLAEIKALEGVATAR